jgi:hypothetical protein
MDTCNICTDDAFMITLGACKHQVCASCLSKLDSCPYCRSIITDLELPQLKEQLMLEYPRLTKNYIKGLKSRGIIIEVTSRLVKWLERNPDQIQLFYLNSIKFNPIQRMQLELSHDLNDKWVKFQNTTNNPETTRLATFVHNTARDLDIWNVVESKLCRYRNVVPLHCMIDPFQTMVTIQDSTTQKDYKVNLLEYHLLTTDIEQLRTVWKGSEATRLKLAHSVVKVLGIKFPDLKGPENDWYQLAPQDLVNRLNEDFKPYDIAFEALPLVHYLQASTEISADWLLTTWSQKETYYSAKKILEYTLNHPEQYLVYQRDGRIYFNLKN